MMQYIRERATGKFAKFLFLGIGISFLGFGGSGMLGRLGNTTIAKVNGEKIPESYVVQEYTNYLQNNGGVVPEGKNAASLKREVLDAVIQKEILLQTAKKMGIVVSDSALRKTIMSLPFLQDAEGKFSDSIYKMYLGQSGVSASAWEASIRQQMTLDLLISSIGGSVIITDANLEDLAKVDREKRDLSIVRIPFNRFTDEIQISDELMSTFYEQNRANLLAEPKVKLAYVTMPAIEDNAQISLSDDEIDSKVAALEEKYRENEVRSSDQLIIQFNTNEEKEQAVASLMQILAGLKDGTLTYDDAKAQVESMPDGLFFETGNTRRSAVVTDVDKAIFELTDDNQYSEPVFSENAVHVIRLLSVSGNPSHDNIRQEAADALRAEKKLQLAADHIQKFQEVAEKNYDSLDLLAQEFNIPIVETDWLNMNSQTEALADKNTYQVVNQEMVLLGGKNSEAYETANGEIRIVRVVGYEAERPLTFDEAKEDIQTTLIHQEAQKRAQAIIAEVNNKLKAGGEGLNDILQSYDLTASDYDQVEIRTLVSLADNDASLIESLLKGFQFQKSNPVALQSYPIEGGMGAVIVRNITPGRLDEYSSDEIVHLRERLKSEMAQAETILFMNGLQSQSKIEMYQTPFLTE